MQKISVFGGSLINRIIDKTKLGRSVTDKCMWLHPFTFCEGDSSELNSINKLDSFLDKCLADTLIIELSSIRQMCFKTQDEKIYRFEDVERYEKEKETKIIGEKVKPREIDGYEKSLRLLCKKLKEKFQVNKIILLSAKTQSLLDYNGYYLLATSSWILFQELLEKCEEFVLGELKCSYINITQYYIPNGQSDSYDFTNYYYAEIEKKINNVLMSNEIVIDNHYNEKHKYFMAAKGFNSLYRKSVLKEILDYNNPVDVCISYSNKEFIIENVSKIIEWNKKRYIALNSLMEDLKIYENNKNALFEKILLFIAKVIDGITVTEEEEKFIDKNLVVNELLCVRTAKVMQMYEKNFQPKLIISKNVRYYMNVEKLIKGKIPKNLSDFYQGVERPMLIDIWGSCISRLIFNYAQEWDEGRYVVNKYVFHANPLNLNKTKKDFQDFIKIESLNDEIYSEKNLKIQISGDLKGYYENTDSKWIIIDLYSLFAENVYKVNDIYLCTGQNIGNRFLADGKCLPIFQSLEYDTILSGMVDFILFLKTVYKDRIILLSSYNSLFYARCGVIFPFKSQERLKQINNFLENIEKWFVSSTNCYYLKLAQYFISDDEQMVTIEPYHYEKQLYIYEYRYIRQICEGTYEGKRCIETINPDYLLTRFIKYKEKNGDIILKINPYDNNLIWRYLIKLDKEYLNNNFAEICKLISEISNCTVFEQTKYLKLSQKEQEVYQEIFKEKIN